MIPPPPPLTTSNPITAPSPYTPGMISGLPYPLTNSDPLKKVPIPWSSSNHPSRCEEVVLARLRIGHTRLTHSFLYLGLPPPPSWPYRSDHGLSVQHFFSCPALENNWLRHSVSPTLTISLSNNHGKIIYSMNYLWSTNVSISSNP